MRCLFFVVFVYAVRCEDGNYYVIQVPHNEPQRILKVYWNVPTMQCQSKKVPFEDLYRKYGIHQNQGDKFQGEEVTIMYDPGLFPALLKNETSGKFKFRNGGVPQEGDLAKHLEAFRKDLDLSIPDLGFKGIGIIDFESWRPIYRQNFGVLSPYKDVSYEIERKLHWWWHKSFIETEAKRRFESSARTFMEETISLARQLRPGGVWGYYGFPYCFNMASNNMVEGCANKVPEENDRLSWLWRSSTALYPSVYSSASLSTSQLAALIRGRVREARRVKRGVVLPYFWYRYRDGGFFTQTDLNAALNELYKSNASGFIIWGSSKDVNTVDKCKKLYNYVDNVFGPAVARYTKKSLRDEVIDGNNSTNTDNNYIDTNNNATIDVDNRTVTEVSNISDEIRVVIKRNSTDGLNSTNNVKNGTDDIKKDVEEEIVSKFTNYVPINEDNTSEKEEAVLKNNNVLIDLIINSILNKEFNSLSNIENESTPDYNLINAATESSPSTKNSVKNINNINDNSSCSNENQSTMNNSLVNTTETTQITSNNDVKTVDYNNNESHKETTQIDTTTEYSTLDNDMLFERSFIENDSETKTTVTDNIDKATDFIFDATDGTDFNFDFFRAFSTIDFTTTESTKSTKESDDKLLNEPDKFFNANTFTTDEITATEMSHEKNIKKDIFIRMSTDVDRNESEFNESKLSAVTNETQFKEINKENEFTEKLNQTDATIEPIYDSTINFDTFNGTNSIITLANLDIFTTESQNINTKSNSKANHKDTTKLYADFSETSTSFTEKTSDFFVSDETTILSTISTIMDENRSSIEVTTATLNSRKNINDSNFDNTTVSPVDANKSGKSTEDSTAVNNQETIDYTTFDETTATSIASLKAESKSSIEDSTAVSAKEDKVVVYVL